MACGSCSGSARLSTLTRSPPTAATSERRSAEVVTTSRSEACPGAAHTASARRKANLNLLLDEDILRDHAVDALADVHDLRHAAIADHGDDAVGFIAVHRHHLLAGEEVDRLAHRVHHGLVEILVESHGDPVRLRLDERPLALAHVLAYHRLQADPLV